MAQEPIQVIVLQPVTDGVRELLSVITKSNQAELIEVGSPAEALQVAQQFLPCAFIVSIKGLLDGAPQVEMLKKLQKHIKSGQLKTIVASANKNHPEAKNISALGITDYIEEPIPLRALLFKINLIFKALHAAKNRLKPKEAKDERLVFKASEKAAESETISFAGGTALKYKPALQIGEDTFIFKNCKPKNVGGKHIFQADGPDPETGNWELEPGKSKSGEKLWRWVPKTDNETDEGKAAKNKDGWIHAGEEPSFNKRSGSWQLKAEAPELFFRRNGKKEVAKVETDDEGNVSIAEDSQTAKDNLSINRTLAAQKRELKFKKHSSPSTEKDTTVKTKKAVIKNEEMTADDTVPPTSTPEEEETSNIGNKRTGAEEDDEETKENLKLSKKEPSERENKKSLRKQAELAKKRARAKNNTNVLEADDDAPEATPAPKESDPIGEQIKLSEALPKSDETLTTGQSDKTPELNKLKARPTKTKEATEENEKNINPKALRDAEENTKPIKFHESTDSGAEDNPTLKNKQLVESEQENKSVKKLTPQETSEGATTINSSLKERAKEKANRRIAELKQAALAEANSPLKESISDEEEAEIRNGLGLADRPEITKKALIKKARVAKLVGIKNAIHEIADSLKGHDTPIEALFPEEELKSDQREKNQNPTDPHTLRAIDSILVDESNADQTTESLKREKKAKKKSAKEDPKLFYLPQDDLQPIAGSWDGDDGDWAYLPNSVFETGFSQIEDLLPLWIYSGEPCPELEIEERRWRFLDSLPIHAKKIDDIPKSIVNILEGLQNQAKLLAAPLDENNPIMVEASKLFEKRARTLNFEAETEATQEKNKTPEEATATPSAINPNDQPEVSDQDTAPKNKNNVLDDAQKDNSPQESTRATEGANKTISSSTETLKIQDIVEAENTEANKINEKLEKQVNVFEIESQSAPLVFTAKEIFSLSTIADAARSRKDQASAISVTLKAAEYAIPRTRIIALSKQGDANTCFTADGVSLLEAQAGEFLEIKINKGDIAIGSLRVFCTSGQLNNRDAQFLDFFANALPPLLTLRPEAVKQAA